MHVNQQKRHLVYIIYILYLCNKIYTHNIMTSITIPKKRKNIDLPVETLQKLSMMAVAQSKSLKAYIEDILIAKANDISIKVTENPSPSGDKWFEDPENMASVKRGIEDMKNGNGRAYSIEEIKSLLGL